MARRPSRDTGDVSNGRGGEVRAYWTEFFRDMRDHYVSMYPDADYLSRLWERPLAKFEGGEAVNLDGSDVEIAHNQMLPGISRRKRYTLTEDDRIIEVPADET